VEGKKWEVESRTERNLESDGKLETVKRRNMTESSIGRIIRIRRKRIREEIEVRRGIKELDIVYSAVAT
jgi:hypothetical protein